MKYPSVPSPFPSPNPSPPPARPPSCREDKEDKEESMTLPAQGTSHCSCHEHCFLFVPGSAAAEKLQCVEPPFPSAAFHITHATQARWATHVFWMTTSGVHTSLQGSTIVCRSLGKSDGFHVSRESFQRCRKYGFRGQMKSQSRRRHIPKFCQVLA